MKKLVIDLPDGVKQALRLYCIYKGKTQKDVIIYLIKKVAKEYLKT